MRFVRDERDTADPADFATELIWPVGERAAWGLPKSGADLSHGWLAPWTARARSRRLRIEGGRGSAFWAAVPEVPQSSSCSPASVQCLYASAWFSTSSHTASARSGTAMPDGTPCLKIM